MKLLLCTQLAILSLVSVKSQCDTSRYISPIFDEIIVQENIIYGTAPQWNFPNLDEDLKMDIYYPQDDNLGKRPCMIWAHPGGFLLGDKQADDMVALCDSFARRGYVTASINYRKGFNPVDATSSERAVYRGLQDGRAAFRYLAEHFDLYNIDTTKIFIGGSSAGALIAHHMSFMEEDERPASSFEQTLAPDLGCIDCSGNDFVHEVNPIGNIALWGAIGDTAWVDNPTPTLLVHGTADLIVPYNVGPPFELFTLPDVYGSLPIYERLTEQNYPVQLESVLGEGHEPHGTANGYWLTPPTPYWFDMFDLIETFSFELLRPESAPISGSEFYCHSSEFQEYSVNLEEGESVCWTVLGGEIIDESENSISVILTESAGLIEAVILNELGAASQTSSLEVNMSEPLEVNWEYSIEGNVLELLAFTGSALQWYIDGTEVSSEAQTSAVLETSGIIDIVLVVSDESGCETTFSEQIDHVFDSVFDLTSQSFSLRKIENQIEINGQIPVKIEVFSLSGKLLFSDKFNSGINYFQAPKGLNIFRVISSNGSVSTKIANI